MEKSHQFFDLNKILNISYLEIYIKFVLDETR